jgi:hypothetical protein
MATLTALVHGSIPSDDEHARSLDPFEVGVRWSDDGVETPLRHVGDLRSSLAGARGVSAIRLHDHDLPAGQLEGSRMDAGKAELEHAAGAVSEQLEDPRRRGGGERRRKAVHRYARYMNAKYTGKFLGIPYDWRRPTWARYKSRWWNTKDRRIVMPRAFGWGYDFNLAEVARRLHLRG